MSYHTNYPMSEVIEDFVQKTKYLDLQFTPNWDVEITREKLLTDANYIAELLQAHIQDWESAS